MKVTRTKSPPPGTAVEQTQNAEQLRVKTGVRAGPTAVEYAVMLALILMQQQQQQGQ